MLDVVGDADQLVGRPAGGGGGQCRGRKSDSERRVDGGISEVVIETVFGPTPVADTESGCATCEESASSLSVKPTGTVQWTSESCLVDK